MPCFSITTMPLKRFSLCLLFIVSLYFFTGSDARPQYRKESRHLIQVHIDSLHPQEDLTCKHSPRGKRKGASLEVVHRHGPCSNLKPASSKHGSHSNFDLSMQLDQQRVDAIHARLSGQSVTGDKALLDSSSVNLPAQAGATIGSANYIVSVGLGTPQKDLSLIFDTGSDLTWTQCKPCSLGSCYTQVDPIFDPSSSSSYANISCNSALCTGLTLALGAAQDGCSSSTCVYKTTYGDKSSTEGFLAKERLTLTSSEYVDCFVFGCGEDNGGLFRGSAGLIGLGRSSLSLVSQAANKYGNYFSYCLPSSSSSTGHLTLGQGGTTATSLSYTPLLTNSGNPSFYFVDLQSISVNGQKLPISPAVFSAAGTIIDSGTVISRLPQQAYSALSAAFKQHMSSKYPPAPASGIFDTCFDFSNQTGTTLSVPEVTLYFAGGGVLVLPFNGIMFSLRGSHNKCLAFAANAGSGVGIVGNVQQQGFDVVFDVDGAQIGFGPNAC